MFGIGSVEIIIILAMLIGLSVISTQKGSNRKTKFFASLIDGTAR